MEPKKIMIMGIIGNALEFYDFTLYGVFASIIANYYFPGSNETARLLASLAAFGAGFLTRPFGGMLFGYIGGEASPRLKDLGASKKFGSTSQEY